MKSKRPVNLNLFTIHFPIPAILSITHRITGVALFLLIPVLFLALDYSLTEEGFNNLQAWFRQPLILFLIWLFLIPYVVHLIAGIRHLLMDLSLGDSLSAGRKTAYLTFILSFIVLVLLGIWLW